MTFLKKKKKKNTQPKFIRIYFSDHEFKSPLTWRTKLFEVVSDDVLPSDPLNLFFLRAPFPYDWKRENKEEESEIIYC